MEKVLDRILEDNKGLVERIARRYEVFGDSILDHDDLVQEGYIGLMKAIEKFDESRGVPFADYASWWVRESIFKAVHDQSRAIRLPVNVSKLLMRYKKERNHLENKLKRPPTLQEIADHMGIELEEIRDLVVFSTSVTSTDTFIDDDDNNRYEKYLEDPYADVERDIQRELLRERVEIHLGSIPARDRMVVRMRFGLNSHKQPRSLEETGEVLGISYERARQIESEALKLLSVSGKVNIQRV